MRYGAPIIAGTSFLFNLSVNIFYRKCFFLDLKSTFASFISSSLLTNVFPSVASTSLVYMYYTQNLLKISPSECLVCRELKTIGSYMAISGILPIFISWSMNFLYADLYKTYGVPKTENIVDPKKFRNYFRQVRIIWSRTNKNSKGPILRSLTTQFFVTSFILFMQQKQFKDHIEPYSFTNQEVNRIKYRGL